MFLVCFYTAEVVCCAYHGTNMAEGRGPWSEGSTQVDLVCDTIPGGNLSHVGKKKKKFWIFQNLGNKKVLLQNNHTDQINSGEKGYTEKK